VLSQNIREIFEMARKLAPTIIFMEDLDFYASKRGANVAKQVLGELLAQLDGFEENHGIIVIATTNDYDAIDSAISDRPNRFDKSIEIPKPNAELREIMLKRKFKQHICEGLDFKKIALKTNGFSGAHVEELVTLSMMEAVKNKSLNDKKKVIIKNEHVEVAILGISVKNSKSVIGISLDYDNED
jgi:SpoVK/Ycf46/Vps4 family AAA+-type ATPase